MKIFKQKHINNVDVIIREAGSENPIMLMVSIEKLNKKEIEKAGFTQPFEAGKKVAPPAIGPKTKENIHGRSFPLRDKPKMEKTYSYYRSFFDWHGNEHFAVFSVKRMVYSRREEPGFCENLSIKIINGEKCISTGFIDYKKDPKRLLNAANVMLECFGEFWIGGKNQIAIQSIKTENPINLSWTIFPKGEPIGERLVSEIAPCLKRVKPCQQPIVNKRVETIRKIFPDIKAIGNAGFFGYIVFFNPKKNVYAVESVLENNATYILGEDWERITQMTKSEILNGGLAIKRVIHSENWEFEISRFR